MTERIAQLVLGLPGWAALVVVFALPGLESSAFVGFVFPGEVALLLGGVLAEQGRLPLVAVLAAGFAGAVLGDSVGYAVGRRYGRRLLDGTLGRFVKRDHLDRAERYLAVRGGRAVFLGRFTAALRVMVPGAAGMARMPYVTFLVNNVAGAAGWVTLSVLLAISAAAAGTTSRTSRPGWGWARWSRSSCSSSAVPCGGALEEPAGPRWRSGSRRTTWFVAHIVAARGRSAGSGGGWTRGRGGAWGPPSRPPCWSPPRGPSSASPRTSWPTTSSPPGTRRSMRGSWPTARPRRTCSSGW